ncbi:MAG: hypothetical protein WC595_00520 [Candidatus Nanoarchaeia archaeon]
MEKTSIGEIRRSVGSLDPKKDLILILSGNQIVPDLPKWEVTWCIAPGYEEKHGYQMLARQGDRSELPPMGGNLIVPPDYWRLIIDLAQEGMAQEGVLCKGELNLREGRYEMGKKKTVRVSEYVDLMGKYVESNERYNHLKGSVEMAAKRRIAEIERMREADLEVLGAIPRLDSLLK